VDAVDLISLVTVITDPIRRVAELYPEVRAVYIFGSQSRGVARPDSDVDLGVLYRSRQALSATLQLERELEQAVGRKIDLIDATDHFELYVLRRAGELLPFERQRQALLLAASG